MEPLVWDEQKRVANLRKHGIDFAFLYELFADFISERVDDRKDYGEVRWMAYGILRGEVVFVVYTRREYAIRIISARKASRKETEGYRQALENGLGKIPQHEGL